MISMPPDLEAVLLDLRSALTADVAPQRWRFWRRRRLVLFALVPALLGVGTGAWALTQMRGEDVTYGIECHDEPSLHSSATGVLTADGRDPVAACAAAMWPDGDAPELVACAHTDHPIVSVFPGSGPRLCGRLGLAVVPAGYREAARRTHAMVVELQSRLNRRRCYSEREGVEIGNSVLARHGFGDWKMKTIGFGDVYGEHRVCATGDYVWIEPRERVAGLTGTTERPYDPAETALEQPGCHGLRAAVAALDAGLAPIPRESYTRVEPASGTPTRLPCSAYGIVDFKEPTTIVIGRLGPP
jgi:hypothetical protein